MGITVSEKKDYLLGVEDLPKSDVIKYFLEDGSTVVIRPSGTEPKLKAYISTFSNNSLDSENKNSVLSDFISNLFDELGSIKKRN